MTTLHANSPWDAIHRLQLLAGFAGFAGAERTLLQQISSALDLVVHVSRLPGGKRRLISVQQVGALDDGQLQLAPVFGYDSDADRHSDLLIDGGTP